MVHWEWNCYQCDSRLTNSLTHRNPVNWSVLWGGRKTTTIDWGKVKDVWIFCKKKKFKEMKLVGFFWSHLFFTRNHTLFNNFPLDMARIAIHPRLCLKIQKKTVCFQPSAHLHTAEQKKNPRVGSLLLSSRELNQDWENWFAPFQGEYCHVSSIDIPH